MQQKQYLFYHLVNPLVPKLFHDFPSKYASLKRTMGMNGLSCIQQIKLMEFGLKRLAGWGKERGAVNVRVKH